jgi:gamma-glutamyltranspeptidase/glutathione hydrolase
LQSFNTWEGSPNCIEPGKRPRITLTPTLVLKDGKPVLAVSVAGGDLQDQAILQLLVDALDFGLSPEVAVTAPRFATAHHLGSFRQTAPRLGSLTLHPDYGEAVAKALTERGHTVTMRRPAEAPVVIATDPATGLLRAAGDPRARRHAAAY